jgi:uncharacterized DUF497 family protein
MYGWDEGKRKANISKHGVDFAAIELFDWEDAVVQIDDRDYEELVTLRSAQSMAVCMLCGSPYETRS